MARVLLFLLAALTAGIGFVMGSPEALWLYAAAGALVVVAMGLWVRDWRKTRRREERKAARAEAAGENNDLRSLGIMEIRPRERAKSDEASAVSVTDPPGKREPSEEKEAPQADRDGRSEGHAAASQDTPPREKETPTREEASASASPAEEAPEHQAPTDEEADENSANEADAAEDDVPSAVGEALRPDTRVALAALVRALRLAAGARLACLLTQEELAHDYRIDAIDAGEGAPPHRDAGDTFSTNAALLSAGATRQPVTHRAVGAEEELAPRSLGYYRRPEAAAPEAAAPEAAAPEAAAPEAVALVPIPLPDDPATRFLLLDGPRGAFDRRHALLEHFARLFAQIVEPPAGVSPAPSRATSPVSSEAARPSMPDDSKPDDPARSQTGRSAAEDEGEPRPRSEIVAEEMSKAGAESRELALALVYLNRAETVAARGEEEVQAAERALRARLRQVIPEGGRVERFGELTYGVFVNEGSTEAERWAIAVQDELERASDPLEGGVSVGLAPMRDPEQDPEALRQNATNALREAYTTGTCTILE